MVKQKSLKKKRKPMFTVLFLAIYTIITAIPLYYVLINAFKKNQYIANNPMDFPTTNTFTLDNIIRAWDSLKYAQSMLNTVIIVGISCIIIILIGSLAGFAIAIVNSRALNLFYIVAILVITIPFQVIMVPVVVMLKNANLLNSYFGTSMIYVGIMLPIVIFLYTGFMRSLPRELCESAIVDGCGMFKVYFYIYLPLMKTVTGTVLIIKGTSIWNDFLIPLVTLNSSTKMPIVVRLYSFASVRFNSWDLMFGGAFLCAIPIVILFVLLQRSFIQGIVAGAVKG